VAGPHCLNAKRDGQVALTRTRWPEQVHHLMAGDEVELRQRQNAVPVQRGLEREVEGRQGLDRAETRHLQRSLDAPALAQRQFLGQQGLERLQGADLATLDLAHHVVEHLQGARHAQPDQVPAQPLQGRRDGQVLPHFRGPWLARRCPTAA
jgi:hypothetical protein